MTDAKGRVTSQFCYGKCFLHGFFFWGGGLHKNVSQFLATIDFFKQRNYRKTLSARKNIIGSTNLAY